MRRVRTSARLLAGLSALAVGLALVPGAATADRDRPPEGPPKQVTVVPKASTKDWQPLTPSKWSFGKGQVVQTERGDEPEGPRRPFEYATVTKGPELASLDYSATVRIDEPVSRDDRDVVLIWNYQSPTRFYYAHLSQDNTIEPHNGIFVVDDADRRRIDDQWDGSTGAAPAIDDVDWHDVRLTYDAPSGDIAVRVDGDREPLMTATDTTFSGGRVGFGSFDNHGRVKHVKVKGVRASDQPDPNAPITDPIPQDPKPADLALELTEVAQLPESEPTPEPTDPRIMRHNRINFVSEVPDGSGRLAVPDLNGPMYLMEDGEETEYLDVREHDEHFFSGRGMGSGFGFVTFHPEFERNGKFYTTHTVSTEGIEANEPTYPNQPDAFVQSVVTEWTADDPSAESFSGSTREIFRFGFTQQIHAIQQIDFNPTAKRGDEDYGLLYLAVGDGGIGVDTDVPQDKGNPAGKILRIDPLGEDGPNGQYGIPASNPFVDEEGALGEIYALGMRDPHRFTWDPRSPHRMFLGHIGQRAVEAVYEVRKGDNLGWSDIEGRLRYDNTTQCWLYPLTAELRDKGYTYPVASYDHDSPANWECNEDSGHAISGGQVYRGPVKELRGRYVFGDLVNGSVFSTDVRQMRHSRDDRAKEASITELALQDTDGNRMRMTDFVDDVRVDLRFGTDARGDLYLLAKSNGTIWKVTDAERVKPRTEVDPRLADKLVSFYDFERGFAQDATKEEDGGDANLLLDLINGGKDMRVRDAAYPGSVNALQTRQVSPGEKGDDDWKAGIWDPDGVQALERFSGTEGITVMGWFKMTGDHPAPNSNTADPDDVYNAVGLAGLLSGDSDGHGVRALLELIDVDGELRLVALGRRLDEGSSRTFAASADWQDLLPKGEWVHLAATFDYTTGDMALYRNGKPLKGFYTDGGEGDPWDLEGTGGGATTSPTLPKGLKIGGSFPQGGQERNPCDCRMDALMLLDDALDKGEVARQYRRFGRG